ncbi:CHAT domain-containing protein [Actinomadura viridis]|uniref:Tetratricopeptide (TPR) repeat protein n=1 Tax=Actinomadura viridis TaxID=58110 RepID=A0A931DKR4_9ACTN|nr:CHAT domain-containing protein [Actinomadura viridis]MBG6091267.1 tetratricopeptide (TPR) repeat protein [Actinomadura viridis]
MTGLAGPRAEADALLRLAAADPAAAHAGARAFLSRAGASGDRTALATGLRAAGLAAKELGLLDEGVALLGRALEQAEGYEAALVRMNLVGLLSARGDFQGALAQAARAEGVLRGDDADRLAANLACALARSGHVPEADAVASRALPRLRDGGDPVTLTGLLTNLGLARALRGDLGTAEAALTEAVAVGEAAGLGHLAAMARGNLAFVASRRGDVPRALRLFAAAEPGLTRERVAQCRFDRSETLIQAGLPGEARALLKATLADVTAHGYACDTADGLLLLAHAELACGDPEQAAEAAERARAAFAGQGRAGWAPLAEHLLLRARWAAGDRSAVFLRSAAATAERLQDGGWAEASAEARVIAARVALSLGRPAGHLLEPVSRTRERGPAALRAAAWHATALEREARHDRDGARAAIGAGLRVVEEYIEVFGALELRARAAGLGDELAGLGLRSARSARELLSAEERRRALARPASLRPPRDPVRAAALAELRTLSARHTAAVAQGRAPETGLSARLAEAEAAVQARTRRRQGEGAAGRTSPRIRHVMSALGRRVLVELVRVGGDLHAVTVRDGRARRHRLGPYAEAAREVRLVGSAARRLAGRGDDPRSRDGLDQASRRLDALLLGPLRRDIDGDNEGDGEGDGDDRVLVIAPTGALHELPWAVLPSLAGRPFTLVPSAAAWMRARAADTARRRAAGHVLLASGPGLEHAGEEIRLLRGRYPGAVARTGAAARAEAVRDALDGADLAHLAAHGEFRDGAALFSRLRMADGPLMLLDLEELAAPPRLVTLSACDLGRAEDGRRDAVIGMAGVLLALGTATVIASVTPVRDEEAPAFMDAFHAGLAGGLSPARALASAPRSPGVAGFTCFGAD